jgi:hypothetical protein
MAATVIIFIFGLLGFIGLQQNLPCHNLSTDDCAIIESAAENTIENLDSFAQDVSFDLSITGLEALGAGGDMTLNLTGNGSFIKTEGELPFAMMMEMELNASANGADDNLTFNFIIADGILYFADPETEEWMGLDITESGMFEELPLGAFLNGDTSEDVDAAMALQMLGIDAGQVTGLEALSGFLNHERLEDEDGLIPFSFTADFAILFAAPEFQEIIGTVLETVGETNPDMAMAQMILPSLLTNTKATANITRWVNPEDNFIHKITVDVNANIDINALMTAMGDSSGTTLDPVNIDLSFSVELSEHNNVGEITAPENATLIDQ